LSAADPLSEGNPPAIPYVLPILLISELILAIRISKLLLSAESIAFVRVIGTCAIATQGNNKKI
jgi:hypothetical protein